jgi:hypothetical protein
MIPTLELEVLLVVSGSLESLETVAVLTRV